MLFYTVYFLNFFIGAFKKKNLFEQVMVNDLFHIILNLRCELYLRSLQCNWIKSEYQTGS